MTKTKLKTLLSIFLMLILVSSCCFATDAQVTSEGNVDSNSEVTTNETSLEDTATTEWTNTDLYAIDDVVNVTNVVDGNAFIIGNEVTISGEIGGDLFVIANKLNIEGGYVYSNLFACANEITLNGVVYDLYSICNNFTLANNGFVYRDMRLTASNVNLQGRIRRDAYISCENMNLTQDLGTLIYGNLTYTSASEISIPEGVVSGTTTYNEEFNFNYEKEVSTFSVITSYALELLKTLFYTLVVTLILLWLTPNYIEKVSKMSTGKSFACLGIGFGAFVAFFVFVIISIFLIISIVAIPVALIGVFASILVAYSANAIASIFFGKLFTRLFKMEGKVKFVLFTLLSSAIIWAISLIPFVGGFLSFLIWLFGIGALILNIFNQKENTNKEEIKEENKENKEDKKVLQEAKKVEKDTKKASKEVKKETKKTTKKTTKKVEKDTKKDKE